MVMTHSDDSGLVLPPNVAPTQVILVPISPKGPEKAPHEHAKVMAFVERARGALVKKGVRVQVDTRFNMKPGPKFYEWEKKGVPLRIECGPRDVETGTLVAARRTGGDKFTLSLDETFSEKVVVELAQMQSQLLQTATERLRARTLEVDSYEEMSAMLQGSDGSSAPGFFLVPWHDDAVAEQIVKKETKATIRCFPFDEQHRSDGQKCFMTGRPATHMALFARAF
jgi:prolyl-tRNA synthetase